MKELYPWQKELWQRWTGLRSRLPHALLLKGAPGIGKLDFAITLAQSLLCENPLPSGLACGSCPSCHWFLQETHPDFRLLQPEALAEAEDGIEREGGKKASRQISIDQIRALSDFSNLSAYRGGHRVVVIYPAEAMNTNAANALLKTLEEPTGQLLFILVSHKPQQLLPTILSRCLVLAMPAPAPSESVAWLNQQGVDNPAVALAQAGYAPLHALRIEESGEGSERGYFLQEVRRADGIDPIAVAEQLQKTEAVKVIQWLQQWCYDLQSSKLTGRVRYHPELAESIKVLAAKVPQPSLLQYQKELAVAKREAFHPLNPRLLFESIFLSYRQMLSAA
jgi:DNA polymerase-3 subunit delta'